MFHSPSTRVLKYSHIVTFLLQCPVLSDIYQQATSVCLLFAYQNDGKEDVDVCIREALRTRKMGKLHGEGQLPILVHLLNGFVAVTQPGKMIRSWMETNWYWHCLEDSRKSHRPESCCLQ